MYAGPGSCLRLDLQVLTRVRTHPDSWFAVDTILATSHSPDTKFFALNVLENVISTRWMVLTEPQKAGIKNYVVQLVIKISADEHFATSQKHVLTKLNETLVNIVKQEWPHAWENFIPDICGSCKTNQLLCENNLRILNMMSEEIFTFGKSQMVSKKVAKLKESLNSQFAAIYAFWHHVMICQFTLRKKIPAKFRFLQGHVQSPGSVKPSLITTTLSTLANFLEWIALAFIFETDLIQILLLHFWDPLEYRLDCARCLNEIACLHEGVQQYQPQIIQCFQGVVEKIQQLPENINEACANLPGPQRVFWEVFHNQVALLLTGFLKHHMAAMEAQSRYMIPALNYLVRISMGPNEETFKICVEFWQTFSARVYLENQAPQLGQMQAPLLMDGHRDSQREKLKLYAPVLAEVRQVLISKMAKPPEVTIKENEEGHIVRVEEEDTDELALYKMMREALIYLTHLDSSHMERIVLQRVAQECLERKDMEKWIPTNLNRLCYAIGSISGAMQEVDERRFVVSVIKDLLSLCDMKKGKENKAAVASNVMYVVGQYPRFLRAHWKFLKTVVFKLFEFMHETFPGVQQMAVDTFLRICQKCKKKFITQQNNEPAPFIETMPSHIAQDISELEPLQICTFFEAVGHMISAASSDQKVRLIALLMGLFNDKWAAILRGLSATGSLEAFVQNQQVLREISLILRVNERMVVAIGTACHAQLAGIYGDMLKIYKVCSDFISHSTAQQGAQVMNLANVKLLRNVKRDTLRLVRSFVDAATPQGAAEVRLTPAQIAQRFVPPLLEPVLADYRSNMPQARDAEVLDLLTVLATRIHDSISQEVGRIFEMVLECTCDMIKGDFQSYPDHRVKFYDLLKAINANCFQALFYLPEAQLILFVDSLIWAMKHEQPQVADSGLQVLSQFLERLLNGPSSIYVPFFKQYYFLILQAVIGVLTDTSHKSGFKLQQHILLQLIVAAENQMLSDAAPKQRVMEFLFELIGKSFPTLNKSQAEIFVLHCFNKSRQPVEFQQHIRDFLIQLKEWGSHESALYEVERQSAQDEQQQRERQLRMQVPGLVPQYDPSRNDMDDL
ncbi:Xpo1 [Symbiodinium necroappetens]|uniref:Exportin-1 n=1 Tax=Symbiodinium necroappetens TaxID=1628268 RepID=A0A812JHR0_9DINO|nr:Xpo1 [Symbiodinium necroappetens]